MLSRQVITHLDRVLSGVLGGVWLGSLALLLLSLMPEFEFVCPMYGSRTAICAAILTVSRLGFRCFLVGAVPLFSPQVWLEAGKRLLKWVVGCFMVAYLLLYFTGGYSILLYAWLIDTSPAEPRSILFRRGWATVQLRPLGSEIYSSPRPGAVVVHSLLPFFNMLTDLPADQPDSTWTPVTVSQESEVDLAKQWQVAMLNEVRANRQEVAAQRKREALDAMRVFNTLHFELNEPNTVFNSARDARSERRSLPDTLFNPALYARLGRDKTLQVRATVLNASTESFSLTLTGFHGIGRYELGSPPPPTSPAIIGPGYAELLRYHPTLGGVAFISTAGQPTHVCVTRYDSVYQVVEGTFEGIIKEPNGQSVSVEEGSFEVRYQ